MMTQSLRLVAMRQFSSDMHLQRFGTTLSMGVIR